VGESAGVPVGDPKIHAGAPEAPSDPVDPPAPTAPLVPIVPSVPSVPDAPGIIPPPENNTAGVAATVPAGVTYAPSVTCEVFGFRKYHSTVRMVKIAAIISRRFPVGDSVAISEPQAQSVDFGMIAIPFVVTV
jgi:hypothetical protein